jgi:hypothetical protein
MWIKNGIYLNKWIITLIIISLNFYFYLKKNWILYINYYKWYLWYLCYNYKVMFKMSGFENII